MSTRWQTVGLLTGEYPAELAAVGAGFDLGGGVSLTPAPSWIRDPKNTRLLSHQQREVLVRETELVLQTEYEASSFGEPDPESLEAEGETKQRSAHQRLMRADIALWLAKPSEVGFGMVMHAHDVGGRWAVFQSLDVSPLRHHVFDQGAWHTAGDLRRAADLNRRLSGLKRSGPVWFAVRSLWISLCSWEWDARYLLLWPGLEALFGTSDEIRFRLAQRASLFLGKNAEESHSLFVALMGGYKWRSKLVHGVGLDRLKADESGLVLHEAECVLRRALVRVLLDDELTSRFSGGARERYLDGLIFERLRGEGWTGASSGGVAAD